jgi:hypothetical protein
LSELALAAGRPGQGAELLAAAFSIRQRTGVRSPAGERLGVADRVAAVRRQLGPAVFARHWATGWVLSAEGAVELGLRSPHAPLSLRSSDGSD